MIKTSTLPTNIQSIFKILNIKRAKRKEKKKSQKKIKGHLLFITKILGTHQNTIEVIEEI